MFDAVTRGLLSVSLVHPGIDAYQPGTVTVDPIHHVAYSVSVHGAVTVATDTVSYSTSVVAGSGPTQIATSGVTATFTAITSAGTFAAQPINAPDLARPGQFSIDGAPAYEVSTTSGVVFPATLCFATAVTDPDVFGSLRVMHGENGASVDRAV